MPLEPATRLGVYEVTGLLGAGGMGEVYRAHDTRLGRDVAIKVLPEGVARDASRLARFEREARFLASLNHPGIAAVYGFEEAEGIPYIVMELVPGETLAAKLTTGALTLEESLSIARQTAEALEAAHEKGVVHRDLKPANIKVTPEGKVKVLDLGLAKAFDVKAASHEDMSRSPTVVLEETRPGVILGTAEFMSPEQARGKAVDKRTDIWAFGCVLFEMLSGRRAFTGETVSDVLVAILGKEPDWAVLPRGTPPRMRDLIARCLEKDPNRRLRDIGDARIEIERSVSGKEEEGPQPFARTRSRRILLVGAAVLVAAMAGWLILRPRSTDVAPPASAPKSLAVLPFRDLSGRAGGQLMGDGLVETVSARLARVPDLQIVTPAATVSAADKEADPYRIAKGLGATLILRGAIQWSGDQIRITYSVLNTQERAQLTGGEVTGSAADLFGIQDRLAESVVRSLAISPGRRLTPRPSGLVTADQQNRYLQALGHLQRYDKASSVDAALRLLETLSRDTASPLVWAALARSELFKFRMTRDRTWADRATTSSARARDLGAELPEVDVTLGELYTRLGRAGEGIPLFERALAEQPNNLDAALGLARAYESVGEPRLAEAAYRRAISLQPNFFAGYNQLGAFYFGRGEYAKAAEQFQRVVALAPDSVRGFNNLGAAYFRIDRFAEARRAYQDSIRVSPSDGAFTNLGTLEFFQGRYREAAGAFEQAVKLAPGKYLCWSNLADAYRWGPGTRPRADPAYEKAIRLAQGEIAVNPRDSDANVTLALCYAKTGQRARARQHLQRALELEPQDPEYFYQAAVVANLEGKTEETIDWLRRAFGAGLGSAQAGREPEFANLRDHPAFRQALDSARQTNP